MIFLTLYTLTVWVFSILFSIYFLRSNDYVYYVMCINPSSRKNLDFRLYDRPYKVLLLTCVASCIAGTISAIT